MIFVDTTILVGAADDRDENHADGRALLTEVATGKLGQALTSDFVLDEAITILGTRMGVGAPRALKFVRGVLASPRVRLLYVEPDTFEAATALYAKFGPGLSFTDVASVALMRRAGCTSLFSHDEGFDRIPGIVRRTAPAP